jgi:hypothetical protein
VAWMSDDIPYLLIVGRVIVNIKATTCPTCKRGTEEFCTHGARLARAITERLARQMDRDERARLTDILDGISRNRAALAASGPWDLVQVAQGTTKMPTWRQSLKYPHHTSGGGR